MKLTKYHYNVLMMKDLFWMMRDLFWMMRFICWFIFIKIVLQVVKKLKKIVIIEKDCDNRKRL